MGKLAPLGTAFFSHSPASSSSLPVELPPCSWVSREGLKTGHPAIYPRIIDEHIAEPQPPHVCGVCRRRRALWLQASVDPRERAPRGSSGMDLGEQDASWGPPTGAPGSHTIGLHSASRDSDSRVPLPPPLPHLTLLAFGYVMSSGPHHQLGADGQGC